MSQFTQHLWESITPIYQSICKQPFIRELTTGKLEHHRFVFYLQQDALYLIDFSRALAQTAAKLHALNQVEDFLIFSHGALISERELHTHYFTYFKVPAGKQQNPACFAYTNYLLATASQRSVEESVAALLPCFWIYAQVGKYILEHAVSDNPYQKWITMYSSDEFHQATQKACDITNILAADTSPTIHSLMKQAFINSSLLEWMFWESTYKCERWPL